MILNRMAIGAALLTLLMTILTAAPVFSADQEKPQCQPLGDKSVKVEGYISKKFKKDRKAIYKEFAEMGNTRVALRPFPMGKTAKVVAVGRCVPAYLARHYFKTALKYTSGIDTLVNQAFYSQHWVGIGTTIFDEPSQQKITEEQLQQLIEPTLSDEEFHALYRKFSIQDDFVPFFGLQRPNIKKVD